MEALRTLKIAHSFPNQRDGVDLAAAHEAGEETFQVHQLLGLLRRHLLLILCMALIGAAAVFGAATYLQKYSAKALILVEPTTVQASASPGGRPSADEQTDIETHIMTLTSNARLSKVVSSLTDAKEVDPATFNVLRLDRNLKVEQELRSRVISVTFTSRDPAEAALVANRVAQLYVDQQRDQIRDYMGQLVARMHRRVEALKAEVAKAAAGSALDGASPSDPVELQRRLSEAGILERALQRQQDIAERGQSNSSGVSILSAATVPERPSTGNPVLLAVPAALAFAILGAFAALVLERSDRSLRSEQDVRRVLGIACYGMAPKVSRPQGGRGLNQRRGRAPNPYAEAIHSILFEHLIAAEALPIVVLVTSTLGGEGKSTLAFDLAAAARRLNRRTVLVDLDWRSARRKRQASSEPGAFDFLADNLREPARPRSVPSMGFDRIDVGSLSGEPSAGIASRRLPQLFAQLRETYDLIIIDGPSALIGGETIPIASLADKIVLAVRWGKTRRELVRSAVARLFPVHPGSDHAPDDIGAVLTRVNLRRHALYRYGDAGEALRNL